MVFLLTDSGHVRAFFGWGEGEGGGSQIRGMLQELFFSFYNKEKLSLEMLFKKINQHPP